MQVANVNTVHNKQSIADHLDVNRRTTTIKNMRQQSKMFVYAPSSFKEWPLRRSSIAAADDVDV